MPRKPESRGTCAYCGEDILKRSVTKHLDKCSKRLESLQTAASSSRPEELIWHLRVQDTFVKDFWLDLEMAGSATLEKLDKYLRAIWLNCCGHLSQFTIGGWRDAIVGKARKVDSVYEPGIVLRHLYDFGTTSETDIIFAGYRKGKMTSKHPLALLARNKMPLAVCQECGQPAKWLCVECQAEENIPGLLCAEHAREHPHENYGGPMPLFNSPRTGKCGYEGPAEPPY
jgi:hypothetical protein